MTDTQERFSIYDLVSLVPGTTERQVRHWIGEGCCLDVENVKVGGRIGQRWFFGPSGFRHVQVMARLVAELSINPQQASNMAASMLLTGEYVSGSFSLVQLQGAEADVPEAVPAAQLTVEH